MKKQVLFLVMVLAGITSATAATAGDAVLDREDLKHARYRYAQPILFVERGVEFLIFSDGSFDFNTDLSSTIPDDDNYYYRRSRTRRNTNRTHGAPGHTYQHNNRGVLIKHDRLGRVRRIGNVFINYDRQGRIKRAGSVYMTYRRGQLRQVGGLRILYNRYGEVVDIRGQVNFNNPNCDFPQYGYNDDWNNYEGDNYYYRRKGKTVKKKKLKRNQ